MDYNKYWDIFCQKEASFYDTKNHKYKKKGYLHFDSRIWFPTFQPAFKKFILRPENTVLNSFLPFLKVVLTTKRIRYNAIKNKRSISPKERPICYAAHFDALIYSFYSTVLSEKYEQCVQRYSLNECVLAYRSTMKSNIDFAGEVFDHIKGKECSAITLDVKSFFDSLNHEHLKKAWLEVLNIGESVEMDKLPADHYKVFKSLTRFSFVLKDDLLKILQLSEKQLKSKPYNRYCSIEDFREKVRGAQLKPIQVNKNVCGIPQGSPTSAVLSNIYMLDYDREMTQLSKEMEFIYRRYCDDIIVVCKTEDLDNIKEALYRNIAKYFLTIQPEKEDIVNFRQDAGQKWRCFKNGTNTLKNLQYLGFEFNGKDIFIRSSSLSKYHRRMKAGVRETIKRAYGRKSKGKRIYRRNLHERFTHLGEQNFITYGLRAADKLNSSAIRKQISKHFRQLTDTLEDKKAKRIAILRSRGKIVKDMS